MIAVVAGLRRQIEGDRQTGLSLGQIGPEEAIAVDGVGMAGIGAEEPGFVAHGHDGNMLAWPILHRNLDLWAGGQPRRGRENRISIPKDAASMPTKEMSSVRSIR